jgi:integrase
VASISRDPGGTRRILFNGADGKRRAIRLGKINERSAQKVKVRVEALVTAQITGCPVDDETARWLAEREQTMLDKLTAAGLVAKRVSATLGGFLDDFVAGRIDVKPATQEIWSQPVRNLKEFFGPDRALRSITAGDAEDFRLYLVGQELAPTTIHKRLQFARQFFRMARRHRLVEENPFDEVRHQAGTEKDRQRFITSAETAAVLEACPNLDWRVIVALSRYGSLRCPSEVLSLRLQDIDRATDKMLVTSPKTEHHPCKDTRVVPLFPELRPILQEAFEAAPEGAVYVVSERYRKGCQGPHGWRNTNLRTTFEKIIRRAGLTPWPRLFHNLRASRETELVAVHPVHVVCAWLGNTPRIAAKHYLQVTEADFQRAVQGGTEAAQNRAQQPSGDRGKCWQTPIVAETDAGGAEIGNSSIYQGLPPSADLCGAHLSLCYKRENGEDRIRPRPFRKSLETSGLRP